MIWSLNKLKLNSYLIYIPRDTNSWSIDDIPINGTLGRKINGNMKETEKSNFLEQSDTKNKISNKMWILQNLRIVK